MILLRVAFASLALAGPALGQAPDPHAGHAMPAPAPSPDPHAGHVMPERPPPTDPHAGHGAPPAAGTSGADLPVGDAPPPPPPLDHAADRVFGAGAMAPARETLRREHGRIRIATTMLDRLELRPHRDGDGYAWRGEFRYGGDINRLSLKTEGEGLTGTGVESAEVQALFSHAIGPYFDLQGGVRHDLRPRPGRSYATFGVQGLAPYWFDVGAALFISDKGDLSARLEADYDLRITQRLILQPAVEATIGDDVSRGEAGLRLRYEIRREFAPYAGLHHELRAGRDETRFVVGLRAWF